MFVIVDIDHTLSDAFWRDSMIGNVPWDEYHEQSKNDKPCKEIIELVNALEYVGHSIIIVTGRNENHRAITVQWLIDNNVKVDQLLMRPEGDFTKNGEMKIRLIKDFFESESIKDTGEPILLIDDNEDTIMEFNKLGITTLQVRNVSK